MNIPIATLPLELTPDQAVEAVYGRELDHILDKLLQGLSALVECDKQLTYYVYRALRTRLRQRASPVHFTLISGQATGSDDQQPQPPLLSRLLRDLSRAVFAGATNQILVLPHLDVLTTTTRSSLNDGTREAAAVLYENPDAVFLAFRDPTFELPGVIENVFTVKQLLVGIPRDRLPHLILQREARKFGVDALDPYALYKYLSGVNPVLCRQILSPFAHRLDFAAQTPSERARLFRDLRDLTLIADVELPNVDLERDIGGYAPVKQQIRDELLTLLALKEQTQEEDEIRLIEDTIPKGLILHGPPGTGKTFFAKAIATALDATITIVSGPELKSKWVGESEQNLRQVFARARKSAPAVIVFDELDSFAGSRTAPSSTRSVDHSMVNQLLTEMDGFRKEELVFVIGTTNFVAALDAALLRPGRFELMIEIGYPNDADRRSILDLYRRAFNLNLADAELDYLVARTASTVDPTREAYYSGDHLNAVMRALKRAEIRSGTRGQPVNRTQIDAALQSETPPAPLSPEEKWIIAMHEAGHAILAYVLPYCPTIERVAIGHSPDALGFVLQAVKRHRYVTIREELLDDICVLLGGRLAEQLFLGRASMGAYSDLQRANDIARRMVEELGMAEDLGLCTFAFADPSGGPRERRCTLAEQTARAIDRAIASLIAEQQQRAVTELKRYQKQCEALRDVLVDCKTVDLEQIKALFDGANFKTTTGGSQ